jgi:hypothetical protein
MTVVPIRDALRRIRELVIVRQVIPTVARNTAPVNALVILAMLNAIAGSAASPLSLSAIPEASRKTVKP